MTKMAKLVHEGHMCIKKYKRYSLDVIYWPNINRDIETQLQRCEICQQHYKPCEPWRKVGADFFQLNGKDYMVVMDYYSK